MWNPRGSLEATQSCTVLIRGECSSTLVIMTQSVSALTAVLNESSNFCYASANDIQSTSCKEFIWSTFLRFLWGISSSLLIVLWFEHSVYCVTLKTFQTGSTEVRERENSKIENKIVAALFSILEFSLSPLEWPVLLPGKIELFSVHDSQDIYRIYNCLSLICSKRYFIVLLYRETWKISEDFYGICEI